MCHLFVIQCYTAQPQTPKHRMHVLLAVLRVSLVVALGCSSPSMTEESIQTTINSIIEIAQITLVHIKELRKNLPASPQIDHSPPSIDGLTSIIHELGLLDNELRSPITTRLRQIQADVSSLEGWLRFLARTLGCRVRAKPGLGTVDNSFPDSRLYLTVTKAQLYLEKFLLNKDKIKVC